MADEKFALKRTVQCPTCPWKVDSKLEDIPDYVPEQHYNLDKTIAKESQFGLGTNHIMSCHYSTEESPEFCVGWLDNQLGPGNNIGLRMRMRNCTNIAEMKVVGEQVERFEDTLPDAKGYDPTKQKVTPCPLRGKK